MILEAWAPDVAGCLEEAVAALASTYGEVDDSTALTARAVELPAGQRETQLFDLLDEVIFALDTEEGVPIAAQR